MLQKPKKLNVTTQKQLKHLKIALIGDQNTGKSTFLQKFLTQQSKQTTQPTLGVESGSKSIQGQNGTVVNVTFWDFSGKLDFVEIRNQFYKEIDLGVVFCDLGNKGTVDSLEYWVREAKDNGATALYIVGNKLDIKKINDVQKIAKEKGCPYFQISAKTGQGIPQLMKKVLSDLK